MTKPKTKPVEALPLEARVIRSISDFPAPKTTQDAVDSAAAEYMTANLIRQYATKRYDRAKNTIIGAYVDRVDEVKEIATRNMSKSTYTIIGAEWQITINANKPVVVYKVDDLRTELIKQGVSAELIDKAMQTVEKKNTPAVTIEAEPALTE